MMNTMNEVEMEVAEVIPPQTVHCRTCKEICTAILQPMRSGSVRGRWRYYCNTFRCSDYDDNTAQHVSQPVPLPASFKKAGTA